MTTRPLCVELFCGTFGWSAGWHEMGGRTLGFDIEHLPHHGPVPPGDDLVLQDVLTLDGRQLKDASLILCSPPCQEFSYMAMPWTRAKQIAAALRGQGEFPPKYTGSRTIAQLTALFDSCFRIQREASDAAGHRIPMVVENVRGAQPWVGRAQWTHGSYALWGDVPALLPIVRKRLPMKHGVTHRSDGSTSFRHDDGFNTHADRNMRNADEPKYILDDIRAGQRRVAGGVYDGTGRVTKNSGGSWFNVAHNTTSGKGRNPVNNPALCPICCAAAITEGLAPAGEACEGCSFGSARSDGVKGFTPHGQPLGQNELGRRHGSGSPARKAASALIARIPLPLSRHIARVYFPKETRP